MVSRRRSAAFQESQASRLFGVRRGNPRVLMVSRRRSAAFAPCVSRGGSSESIAPTAKRVEQSPRRALPGVALGSDPRPPGVKKLHGERDLWRIRVSDYRVI